MSPDTSSEDKNKMKRFKSFNEQDWSQMGDRSKDWTRRQYQKAVADGDKERAKDFIDTYGRGVTLKVGHGQDAQGKEIGKFGEPAFKKRIDKIKKDKTEAVEVDDISVGKKKKKPAGVKADEPLKGYAYNERRVTDIDVEQAARELKKAKLDKAKEKVQKEEQEEKHYLIRVVGKGGPGRDYMNVKTRATSQKAALEKIRKQYPGNSYSVVKEDYDTSISLSIEEIEMNEALSPKEKEKRLLMIKKAVQKLNRANIEKAKKMAMRDMKASGMFDDAIEEGLGGLNFGYRDNSNDGHQGPRVVSKQKQEPELERLKKKLEFHYNQQAVHDEAERKYRKAASEGRKKGHSGVEGNERRADEQEELGRKQTMKIQDIRDEIRDLKNK